MTISYSNIYCKVSTAIRVFLYTKTHSNEIKKKSKNTDLKYRGIKGALFNFRFKRELTYSLTSRGGAGAHSLHVKVLSLLCCILDVKKPNITTEYNNNVST